MLTQPKVLFISSDETESSVLEAVLRTHGVLRTARSLLELEWMLKEGSYDAVFCGRSFHLGKCDAALKQIQGRFPDLPVIIFCSTGDEREWIEVLEAGAFDLLVPAYQTNTVLPAPEQAVAPHEARRLERNYAPVG